MILCIDTGSQLFLAKKYKLPLFLHCRAAHKDFVSILRDEGFAEDSDGERKGVVHSFTGSVEEVIELVRP
jgi:TatD DNase family protein